MKGLLRILTLRCADSTRIVSESLDRELSATERWAIRVHAFVCRSCRRYRRQIEFLRLVMRGTADAASGGLSVQERERVRRAIAAERA
jgi:hypothetical protein